MKKQMCTNQEIKIVQLRKIINKMDVYLHFWQVNTLLLMVVVVKAKKKEIRGLLGRNLEVFLQVECLQV